MATSDETIVIKWIILAEPSLFRNAINLYSLCPIRACVGEEKIYYK